MRHGTRFLCFLILLAASAAAAFPEVPPAAPRACLFSIADVSGAGEGGVDAATVVSQALAAALQAAGYELVPPEEWKKKLAGRNPASLDFLSGPAPAQVARDSGAMIAVTGYLALRDDRILLSVSAYDAATGVLVSGFQRSWRYTLAFYSAMQERVQEVLKSLELPSGDEASGRIRSAQGALLESITFTSPLDGMEVLLGGEKSAGVIRGGSLVYPAAGARAGEPLLVEKRKKGFHTAVQSAAAAAEVPLSPLAHKTWMGVDASWTLGQLAGAGAALRMYVVPDTLFLAPGLYVYAQPSALTGGSTVLHLDFSAVAGVYLFFPPESVFRLGVSAGMGAIFTAFPFSNVPAASDLYLNVLNLWAELNLPAFSLFFREEVKYAAGIGYNLLGSGWVMVNGSFPPLTAGVSIKL
jgi:hypothetical protein